MALRIFLLLLERLAFVVCDYLAEQVRAGADVLMIFDSWGGVLSHQAYQEFSLHWMKVIIDRLRIIALKPNVPIIVFTKGGGQWLSSMATIGANGLGLDWTTDINKARLELQGKNIALQGNLDPCALFASPEDIEKQVLGLIHAYGHHPGLIVNCGHGLIPELDPERVKVMVETVKNFRY
jgi:uroporphyrinogen decarboxylase